MVLAVTGGEEFSQRSPAGPGDSVAFLLSKVGFDAARRFAARLAPLGLEPRHVGLLRAVAAAEGKSQQVLGQQLRITPSRMVALVDDLERRGLAERRPNPADRRAHALHLTADGCRLLDRALQAAAEHENELCADLDPSERRQLAALLRRLAAGQDLPIGTHPGLAGRGPTDEGLPVARSGDPGVDER